ncbi:DUF6603 domain-containing protein [Rhizobacter sp. OV335]|uniref:DUF6603 domain-containing protein n=1 Tax=Rhizobacter sp. OV335 TaxID=1500264 RepID=UPI00091C10F2|nr:DUF6603 domain-containing protein [Rhizobacter sp. OV335]SHN13876.1 hypothetical protein SAMN02787076_03563 [Rhizobacter sp. OV335]
MSDSLLETLGDDIGDLVQPLLETALDEGKIDRLLASVGAIVPDAQRQVLADAMTAVIGLYAQVQDLKGSTDLSFDNAGKLLKLAQQTWATLRAMDQLGAQSPSLAGVGNDLLQKLVGSHLIVNHPVARSLAVLTTLIVPGEELPLRPPVIQDGEVVRAASRVDRLQFDRLVPLLQNPLAVLRAEYARPLLTQADAGAAALKLFPRLLMLLRSLGVSCRLGTCSDEGDILGDAATYVKDALLIHVDDTLRGAAAEAGLALTLSSAEAGDLGLVIHPFDQLNSTRQVGGWTIDLALNAGADALAWGPHGLTLPPDAASSGVQASVTATLPPLVDGPAYLIGPADGSRLEVGGAKLKLAADLSAAKQSLALSADVSKSSLVIASGDQDGFIASLLPSDGLRADFDLGLGWSTDGGLSLRGAAGMDASLPVGLSAGGIALSAIDLGLHAHDGRVEASISTRLGASLGPIQATVKGLGLTGALTFPSTGGNLGVADLALDFKPPDGVGLSIDAHGLIAGGGFLAHDSASGTYSGALQLTLHDQLTVSAYGLIGTRMPDGRPGYSLLVFITAEGFRPVPLGFGIMLQRIGGMLGIQHTFDERALRAAMAAGTLPALLFPRDPVANAPALLQALSAAFPVNRGSIVFGLLARLSWFTPTLVQADLALVLELGARTRLLTFGRVSALLPAADDDLIRLNLDAIGILDFDSKTIELDARLIDSRLVHQFPVTGSAALRAAWPDAGTGAHFVLAVGGLNPHFAPPAGFPLLERVAVALSSGKNPRLVCDAYFAITANTVQFGARASLYAEAAGFSVSGDLGFDALVTLVPPHFIVDFHAAVQLKFHSHNLFKVSLDGTLEGPLPLRIAARAKFEILWFSFSVHFEFTLAGGDALRKPPASISLVDELTRALSDAANWRTLRADGASHGVALRSQPSGTGLVLDPLGQLSVQQQLVPLNTHRDIDTYGGLAVAGPRRFRLDARLDDTPATRQQAAFAPARYFTMSDDEKLAAPSFEAMDAGLVIGEAKPMFGPVVPAPLEYESIVLGERAAAVDAAPAPTRHTMSLDELTAHRDTGAAARAVLRRTGKARFRNEKASPAATLVAPRWQIVNAADTAPRLSPALATPASWSDQRATLDQLNRGGAQWLLVPSHELAAH